MGCALAEFLFCFCAVFLLFFFFSGVSNRSFFSSGKEGFERSRWRLELWREEIERRERGRGRTR